MGYDVKRATSWQAAVFQPSELQCRPSFARRCGESGAACAMPAPQRVGRAFAELASIVAGEFAGMGEAAGLRDARRGVAGRGEAQPVKGVLEPAFLEKALRGRVEVAAEAGVQR